MAARGMQGKEWDSDSRANEPTRRGKAAYTPEKANALVILEQRIKAATKAGHRITAPERGVLFYYAGHMWPTNRHAPGKLAAEVSYADAAREITKIRRDTVSDYIARAVSLGIFDGVKPKQG
jgi:hypothetical protein